MKKGVRKTKRIVKASLLLMAILTVVYAGLVMYANANSSYGWGHRDVVYGAVKYESETPPTEWYTPEQLGIVKIVYYEENCTWFHAVVDREKEPFPLQEEQPIFKYKDKFYQISPLWVTPALPEHNQWQIPTGIALGSGWAFTGVLFLKGRKEE